MQNLLAVEMSVVLCVHSHANLLEFWNRLPPRSPRIAVDLPCCEKHYIPNLDPVEAYIDLGIPNRNETFPEAAKRRAVVIWSENI